MRYAGLVLLVALVLSSVPLVAGNGGAEGSPGQASVWETVPGVRRILAEGRVTSASFSQGYMLVTGSFGAVVYDAEGEAVWRGLENEYVCSGVLDASRGLVILHTWMVGLEAYSMNSGLLWIQPSMNACPSHIEASSSGLVALLHQPLGYMGYYAGKSYLHPEPANITIVDSSGRLLYEFAVPDTVWDMGWSSSGRYLALLAGSNIYVFDAEEGELNRLDPGATVYSIDWSPSSDVLAAAAGARGVLLLTPGGRYLGKLYAGIDALIVRWSPRGDAVAVGGSWVEARVVLLDADEGYVKWMSHPYPGPIVDIEWGDDTLLATYLSTDASSTARGSIRAETLRLVDGVPVAQSPNPYSSFVAAGYLGSQPALVTAEQVIMLPQYSEEYMEPVGDLGQLYSQVEKYAYTNDSLVVLVAREPRPGAAAPYRVTAYRPGEGFLWNITLGRNVGWIGISPDSSIVALEAGGLIALNSSTGRILWTLEEEGLYQAAAWSPDSSVLAVAWWSSGNEILVVDRNGEILCKEESPLNWVESLAWSRHGLLAVADWSKIYVLNSSLATVYVYNASEYVDKMVWSPAEDVLWVLDGGNVVAVDIGNGTSRTLDLGEDILGVEDLDVSSDGSLLALAEYSRISYSDRVTNGIAVRSAETGSRLWFHAVRKPMRVRWIGVDRLLAIWGEDWEPCYECIPLERGGLGLYTRDGAALMEKQGVFSDALLDEDRGLIIADTAGGPVFINITTSSYTYSIPLALEHPIYTAYLEETDTVTAHVIRRGTMGSEAVQLVLTYQMGSGNLTNTTVPPYYVVSPNASLAAFSIDWCSEEPGSDKASWWSVMHVYSLDGTELWSTRMDIVSPEILWSRDSSIIAAYGSTNPCPGDKVWMIYMYESSTGRLLSVFSFDESISGIEIHSHAGVLAVRLGSSLILYNYTSHEELLRVEGEELLVSLDPGGRYAAYAVPSGQWEGTSTTMLAIYDLVSRSEKARLRLPGTAVGMAWSRDSSRIAVAEAQGRIIVVSAGGVISEILGGEEARPRVWGAWEDAWVAWSPDNKAVVAAYNAARWSGMPSVVEVVAANGTVLCASYTDLRPGFAAWRGEEVVVAGDNGVLVIRPSAAAMARKVWRGWRTEGAISGQRAAMMLGDNGLMVVRWSGDAEIYDDAMRMDGIRDFDVSGGILAVSTYNEIALYNVSSGIRLTNYTRLGYAYIESIDLEGDVMAAADWGRVYVYSVPGLESLFNVSPPVGGHIVSAKWSPDASRLAVLYSSGRGFLGVKIYDRGGGVVGELGDISGIGGYMEWVGGSLLIVSLPGGDMVLVDRDLGVKANVSASSLPTSLRASPDGSLVAVSTQRALFVFSEDGLLLNISAAGLDVEGFSTDNTVIYGVKDGLLAEIDVAGKTLAIHQPVAVQGSILSTFSEKGSLIAGLETGAVLVAGWDARIIEPMDYGVVAFMYRDVPVKACAQEASWCSSIAGSLRLFFSSGNHSMGYSPLRAPRSLGDIIGSPQWFARLYVNETIRVPGYLVVVRPLPDEQAFLDSVGGLVLDASGSEYLVYQCNVSWPGGSRPTTVYSGSTARLRALPGAYTVECAMMVQEGYNYTIPPGEEACSIEARVGVGNDTLVKLPYPTLVTTTTITTTETVTETTTRTETETTTETETVTKTYTSVSTTTVTNTTTHTTTETKTETRISTVTETTIYTTTRTETRSLTTTETRTVTRTMSTALTHTETSTVTRTQRVTTTSHLTVTVKSESYKALAAALVIVAILALAALAYTKSGKRQGYTRRPTG